MSSIQEHYDHVIVPIGCHLVQQCLHYKLTHLGHFNHKNSYSKKISNFPSYLVLISYHRTQDEHLKDQFSRIPRRMVTTRKDGNHSQEDLK